MTVFLVQRDGPVEEAHIHRANETEAPPFLRVCIVHWVKVIHGVKAVGRLLLR